MLALQITRKDYNREVEEKVKGLFTRISECLSAAMMNPLYTLHTEITSASFDAKVRDALVKRLGSLIDKK